MTKHTATRIEGTNDYRYRGVRVYVNPGSYSRDRGTYSVADFVLRNELGRLNRKRQFSSLSDAKWYIDANLDKV